MSLSLRSRLLISFVSIVVLGGLFSSLLGLRLINRILPKVENVLVLDLGGAHEIYRQYSSNIAAEVRLTAQQPFVRDHVQKREIEDLVTPLQVIRQSEDLDLLILTDTHGNVLLRVGNPGEHRKADGIESLVGQVVRLRTDVASTLVLSGPELALESVPLVERANIQGIPTAHAGSLVGEDASAGLLAVGAAPVVSESGELLGVLCGGQLLNKQNAIVDRVRNTLYREEKYDGREVAVVSIFLGDKRIATSMTLPTGARAVGTLLSEDVRDRVLGKGEQWIQPVYILDDRYLSAYEPIRDPKGAVIGVLGLGLLERKFKEAEHRELGAIALFTGLAVLLAVIASYLLSNSIMKPLNSLIAAKEKMIAGASLDGVDLEHAPREIAALGKSFNALVSAIHERDQQMRRQTQEKLIRSDRLAMVGQLASGVAHEINNPLGSILLFSRLIMQQVPPEGRVRENLDRIEKETKRCHNIVRSLLDFARQRPPLVESLELNPLMDATLTVFEDQYLFHNIEVVKSYASDLPALQGDSAQLQQVFMNIIMNAVDAMDGKGCLTLETRKGDQSGYVEISITDTGSGIAPENVERIFDPFFTTKEVGHGTGLGLSVSYGIIQTHQGDISVSSVPGSGSRFTVTLPTTRESK
jgi:two-component system NtrC family sensor kinase